MGHRNLTEALQDPGMKLAHSDFIHTPTAGFWLQGPDSFPFVQFLFDL